MRLTRFVLTFLLLLGLLGLSVELALASPRFDRIIQADQTVEDNVTVVNDDLRVEKGAQINGSVTVIHGDVTLGGAVSRDLVVINGDVRFEAGGAVGGSCAVFGGSAISAPESDSTPCTVKQGVPGLGALAPHWQGLGSQLTGRVTGFGHILAQFFLALGSALVMGLLALFVSAIFPRQLRQVTYAIHAKPLAAGAVGFLTGLAVPSLITLIAVLSVPLVLLFCVGLLGFPIVLALSAMFLGSLIMGWVAVGNLLGEWLADHLRLGGLTLPGTAALGTIIITLLVNLLPLLPLGRSSATLAGFVILAVGLGAVTLTKFGMRPYPAYLVQPGKVDNLLIKQAADSASV